MDVEGGTYTITISGLPADASFDATTAEVTIAQSGQDVTRNFSGSWIRTASLMGMVTVEGEGLPGITVSVTGRQEAQMLTDDNGQYTFTGLRAGNYTVEITGFDATGVAFSSTSSAVTVGAGESKVWSFEGTYVRESAIAGQVSVEGNGLSDVTVSLQGMGADESEMTDAGGQFTFSGLRAGEYQLAISGYDTDEYGFSTTSATVRVEHGRTANVPFEGILLRTAAIMGQVSVEGEGLGDVTVSLSGEGENLTTMTDESGQYTFSDLPAGNFQVGISGYDTDDYSFETTSKNVALALGETATVPFEGILLRTSGIAGRVSIGGAGLGDVTVTLSGAEERTATTDATGQYAVAGLAAGDYTVTISGYDASEYAFPDGDSEDVTLDMDQTRIVNFAGRSLRTAAVAVMVTADGEGVAGVTATLFRVTNPVTQEGSIVGAAATGADGGHTFSDLLQGLYLVQISGADAEIDFLTTALPVTALTDMTAEANFPGTINRTASIGGTVTIDGAGMAGVMVMLSGDEGDQTRETDADGAYSFTGLRRGDYEVSITNPNEAMYNFARTSQDVALGLGQAQDDISFAGTQVLMSSISGQVTVEGEALPGVTVTLGGAGDDTRTTGDDGLYSFLNLGSGTYTVSMANPDDAAYIFDTDPVEIMLGNSDEQSHDFGGMHTREASVSGMLFVDEGTKNDLHDEGEYPLAAEGVKVTLVGPTLLMRDEAETDATGAFAFGELRQGSYQLMLSSPDAAVMDDFGYGGDASYDIEVGVGADGGGTQNLPFDITHQTVNFTVNLRSGEDEGDALPGATITVFSDAAGATQIATDMTDADGEASIRFARAGTIGNTVHAAIAAPEGDYEDDPDGDRQAVTWESQYRMTDASNDGDIVNLKAEINFGGATVVTDFGGGVALGGWAISVSSDKSAAADAPAALGATGTASYSEVVMADSLPVTYTVKVAGNQANTLDGNELYAADSLMHTHNGLSLPAAVDIGMMAVTYTTQTLKVYTYHERDQVHGYTGNVLGGDARASGMLDVNIRHLDANGRSRAFPASARIRKSDANGVVTFTRVPAAANVIVNADENADAGNIMLLRPDELAAYEDRDENGIMGGAFGANGGYNHTVELCPLMRVDPTGQDHGECASFAFVSTYAVHGQAWKNAVYPARSGDGFTTYTLLHVAGTRVTMTPVDGKNIAGESESFTAASTNSRLTAHDDRKQFVWGQKAAGAYTVGVPAGWVAQRGTPDAATNDLAGHINPLAGDLQIDVTPTTGFVYGRVTDSNGFAVADVAVSVNGASATSDAFGRYHAEGFPAQTRRIGRTTHSNKTFVETSQAGHEDTRAIIDFAANTPMEVDVTIEGEAVSATITGRVTEGGSPVAGVAIHVNDADKAAFTTKDDGEYSVSVPVGTVTITASKAGMSFQPTMHEITVPTKDVVLSGWNFAGFEHGTISGRVSTGGGPMADVRVTAIPVAGGTAADVDTTGVTGTYSLSVPFGLYNVVATKTGVEFTPATQRVNVAPGEPKSIEDFAAVIPPSSVATLSGLSLSAGGDLTPEFHSDTTKYTVRAVNSVDEVTVTPTTTDADATVAITPTDADDAAAGHQVSLAVGETAISVAVTAADGTTTNTYTVTVDRAAPPVLDDATLNSLSLSDGELDPEFAEAVVSYTASVDNAVESVTVTAVANHQDATMEITPDDADAVADGHQVALEVGDTKIEVEVTAADKTTTETYTVTVKRRDEVPSAPQQLTVTSPESGALTVKWRAPANEGEDGIDHYEYRVAPSQEWTDVTGSPAALAREVAITTDLVDGRASTIEVRAMASEVGAADADIVAGEVASISGTPWSTIASVEAEPTSIDEGDSTTVTVTFGSGAFFAATRVEIELGGDAGATIRGPSVITFMPGDVNKEVWVVATDNVTTDAANNAFTVSAKVMETEAEGRDATVSDPVNVTDNDILPSEPQLVLAGVAGGLDLTITAADWGSAADASRKYQYRHKITQADDDTWSTWINVAATATSAQIRGLINGVGYTVELKAVTAAGESTADEATANAGAPEQ